MQRSLWVTVNSALLLAIIVVLLGGWTRLNYAGLGCPDWPGCYGMLVLPSESTHLQQAQAAFPDQPINTQKGWLEMIHRYAAGMLGVFILSITLLNYKIRKTTSENKLGRLPILLLVLVITQALFGMWTVTLKLLPPVVTLHLLGGLLTLTLLFTLRARLRKTNRHTLSPQNVKQHSSAFFSVVRHRILIAVLLLFVQLTLGGWTSSNYAGWACTDWFFCHQNIDMTLDFSRGFEISTDLKANYEGGLLPQEARAAIQMTHRVMAVLLISYLCWLGWSISRHTNALNRPIQLVLLLAMIQSGLGIANIIWAVPLPLATAHHAVAVGLLLAMLWFYQRSVRFTQGVAYAAL